MLDLTKNGHLSRALPYELAEACFGEVAPNARVVRMGSQRGQDTLRQFHDFQDFSYPGVVSADSPSEGPYAGETLRLHDLTVALGPFPRGLLGHPALVSPPGANPDAVLTCQVGRQPAAQEDPAAVLIDRELLVGQEDIVRLIAGLFHLWVPEQGGQADSS